ncbi:MAG: putative membrane protein [Cryomorphaceae bacterium]|jgi:predicted membrane protein
MIKQKRPLIGIFLIAIGVVFLLNQMGVIPGNLWWLLNWYTILIVLGVYNLLTGRKSTGILLCAIGGVFLFDNLGFYDLNWSYVWPVGLIGLGLLFVFRNSLDQSGIETIGDTHFDSTNILSGGKLRVTSAPLKGGKITSIMGGTEINLSKTEIQGEAVIDVFTLMGGAQIRTPENWNVINEVTSIMGGFDDSRSLQSTQDGPTLRIKGITIMGGIELKS